MEIESLKIRLNKAMDRQEEILNNIKNLQTEYEQLEEDIEMLKMMLMFTANRMERI
jgi:hypothetical protein